MMKKKHKRRGFVLVCIGLLLIAAASVLTAYNLYEDFRASSASEEALEQIKEYSDQQREEYLALIAQQKKEDFYSEEILPDYMLDPYMDMPAIEVDGYRYIGTLTIPPLEKELPIMEEWDYSRMRLSPCRYSGSVYLNNLIICAHNYSSHFGHLDNLQKNDEVIVTDVNGNIFRYKVAQIETLGSRAVEEMTSGDWDLTLFTCTYNGRARVTVRCISADD